MHNIAPNGGGISNYNDDKVGFFLLSGNSYFIANRAEYRKGKLLSPIIGGAISTNGTFTITASAIFIKNTATSGAGGAIYAYEGKIRVSGEIIFVTNTAKGCGGAMYIINSDASINNISAIGNSNSALCILKSNVTFSGRINISNNTGTEGGGIRLINKNSHLNFKGSTVLYGNKAGLGGAIYLSFGTELTFSGDTLFSHNTADTNGGAIYSVYTNIIFDHNSAVSFKWNTAENGGGIYLNSASFLTFNRGVNISMSYNNATKYGGGIYNEDIATANECSLEHSKLSLTYCFIRFILITTTKH